MKVVVAGGTGFLGRALVAALEAKGHQAAVLVRTPSSRPSEIVWNADNGVPPGALDGAHAVINLCGESIADKRWTTARRRRLVHSRIGPTEALVAALHRPPASVRVLLNASALGYYGDTGEFEKTEASPPGQGFLARLCVEWEGATVQAEALGVRAVRLRYGMIVGPGGAVAKMAPLFRKGLGGRLGSGRQWIGWVSLADAVGATLWALEEESVRGPVNVCSPECVRNAVFTHTLADAVGRPVGLPVPAFVLPLALGQVAREALLTNSRARPEILLKSGFLFRHPQLQAALAEALAKK